MMADLLPLKFRIFDYISKVKDEVMIDDILRDLQNEYGTERQFKKSMIAYHLDSLVGVNMIQITTAVLNTEGEIEMKYKITDFGLTKVKYIPINMAAKRK